MERFYIGKCPKCGTEIYSENGMAARFCTHCGAAITPSNGGMAVAYMEKEETAKENENKTVEIAAEEAKTQSSTLQFDTSIPKFDVSKASGIYEYEQEITNEKNRKRAAYIAGGIAAAIICVSALGITSGIINKNHTEPTTQVVTEVPSDPDIDLVEDTTIEEEPAVEEKKDDNKATVTDINDLTIPEKEAVRRASQLLTSIPYSKTELIETMQEEYYGFSESEATAAVEYMENAGLVNFKEEAARWAKTLAEDTSFSRAELLRMLSGEYSSHYTREEAEYAVNYIEQNNLVDWNEMAKKEAELYLSFSTKYTRDELISQLVRGNEFTQSEAEYAANALGY